MYVLRASKEFDFDPIIPLETFPNKNLESFLPWYINPEAVGRGYMTCPNVEVSIDVTHEGSAARVSREIRTPAGHLHDVIKYLPRGREFGIAPFPHFVEPLIKTHDDIDKIRYILPNPKDISCDDYHTVTEIAGENGLVEMVVNSALDFKAGDALGMERILLEYLSNPGFFKEIIALFHQHVMAETRALLEGGVKMIFGTWFYASLSAGWSPETYEDVFFPLLREHVDLVHEYEAIYHFYDDGKCSAVLPFIAEAKVDIIETLTPPPVGDVVLRDVKTDIGHKSCLKGNIDVVHVLSEGSPDTVRESVRQAIEDAADGGGFILSTSDGIRDGTPMENVKAYFRAAEEFG